MDFTDEDIEKVLTDNDTNDTGDINNTSNNDMSEDSMDNNTDNVDDVNDADDVDDTENIESHISDSDSYNFETMELPTTNVESNEIGGYVALESSSENDAVDNIDAVESVEETDDKVDDIVDEVNVVDTVKTIETNDDVVVEQAPITVNHPVERTNIAPVVPMIDIDLELDVLESDSETPVPNTSQLTPSSVVPLIATGVMASIDSLETSSFETNDYSQSVPNNNVMDKAIRSLNRPMPPIQPRQTVPLSKPKGYSSRVPDILQSRLNSIDTVKSTSPRTEYIPEPATDNVSNNVSNSVHTSDSSNASTEIVQHTPANTHPETEPYAPIKKFKTEEPSYGKQSLFGFDIPTETIFFFLVLFLIGALIYWFMSPEDTEEDS